MGRTLYVAAGGGGDVIGATMLHAVVGSSDQPQIATFSWDRLLVDPVGVAALPDHPLPVQVVVAGAGLDGALDPSYLLRRLAELGTRTCGAVRREAVLPVAEVFRWHLSEVSGLLAAAAMGARGRA